MEIKKLQEIIKKHKMWMRNEKEGVRADLRGAYLQGADLQGAYLRGADLRGAYLRGADLRGAYLQGADLQGADLQGAYLQGAYLQGADLQGADLRGAYGNLKIFQSQLNILKHQKGKLIAYKYLDKNMTSPYQHFEYKINKVYVCDNFDENEQNECGRGLNVATLDWCLKDTNCNIDDKVYIEVEFYAKDIIAIPFSSDGKFRVKKLRVVRKLTKTYLKKYLGIKKEKKGGN